MSRTHILAMAGLAVLLLGASARADGLGIPGTRRVTAMHRIVARGPYSEYIFVLYCSKSKLVRDEATGKDVTAGMEADWAEFAIIEPGRPFLIDFAARRSGRLLGYSVMLVAVRRADAPSGSAVDVANAVLAGRVSAATRHVFFRQDSVPAGSGDSITIDYEVRRTDGDRLEVVRTTPDGTFTCCCAAPCFASFATVFGGLYLVHRCRKPPRAPE